MGIIAKLEEKELTLIIVKACLDYAKENKKSFEEVLLEDLLPEEASQNFSDMVCYNLKKLLQEGYIEGNVELVYDVFDEVEDDENISVPCSTFENITISEKGNAYMKLGEFGVALVKLKEKGVPFLKEIGTVALKVAVEAVIDSLRGK